MKLRPLALVTALSLGRLLADDATDFPPKPPVKALTAAEEQKTFQLPPGYRMELILGEPDITEPVCLAFDGNGRLYVAEMRSYMRDIDGTDELVSTSRVSVHWSSKGDGKYDMHRVFANKLKLPRLLLPLADGVLIGETDTNDIYLYQDTNGDGVSDEKKPVYQGGPRGGNHGQFIWRFHPATREFEVFAEGAGNTFCLEFDHNVSIRARTSATAAAVTTCRAAITSGPSPSTAPSPTRTPTATSRT